MESYTNKDRQSSSKANANQESEGASHESPIRQLSLGPPPVHIQASHPIQTKSVEKDEEKPLSETEEEEKSYSPPAVSFPPPEGPSASFAPPALQLMASGKKTIQRFPKSELKDGLGSEFLEKHLSTEAMPSVESQSDQENVLESVYYQRPVEDRKVMNTVFFVPSAQALEQDLKDSAGGEDLDYGTEYRTSQTYDAITVLRVFDEKSNSYKRANIQHGKAKPVVKINKGDGAPSFNHLQKTDPQKLANTIQVDTGK